MASRFAKLAPESHGTPRTHLEWATVIVELPVEMIQEVCVLLEGFDNLAMVRTPVPGQGRVYIYTWDRSLPLLHQALADAAQRIPLRIAATEMGMKEIEMIWSDASPARE